MVSTNKIKITCPNKCVLILPFQLLKLLEYPSSDRDSNREYTDCFIMGEAFLKTIQRLYKVITTLNRSYVQNSM